MVWLPMLTITYNHLSLDRELFYRKPLFDEIGAIGIKIHDRLHTFSLFYQNTRDIDLTLSVKIRKTDFLVVKIHI